MSNADSHGPSSLSPIRDCRIWTRCCAPHMPQGKRCTPRLLLLCAVGLNDCSTISACTLATIWIYHIDEEQIAAEQSVPFIAEPAISQNSMTAYPTPDLGIYGRCSTSAGSNSDAHARSISAILQNWSFYQARVANNAIINIVIQSWTTVRICQIAITPGRAVACTHTHVIPRKSEGYKTAVHPQNRRLKGGRRSHAAI
jgi:hypothetical protein